MGIISKLKSIFGGEDERVRPRDGGTSPSVGEEPAVGREGNEPAAESERAVKGVEPADESGTVDGGVGAESTAETSTSTTDGDTSAGDGEPVDSIKGIGAAYAERLAGAGVHTVSDLAGANAEDLAEQTDLGAGRVGKWIERAKTRSG